jgi:hypothetical protein
MATATKHLKPVSILLWLWFSLPPIIGLWVLENHSSVQILYVYVIVSFALASWLRFRGRKTYLLWLLICLASLSCVLYSWLVMHMRDPVDIVTPTP